MAQQSKWGSIIAGAGFLFICVATLTPGTPLSAEDLANVCHGWCDDSLIADFVRNILLFMPMAFGLRLAGVRTSRAILVGTLLSATVEVLQIRVIVGRDASVLDWVSNSIGTVVGVEVAAYLATLLHPVERTATKLALAATAVYVGALVLGAWGVQTAPSDDGYWGERTPLLGNSVFAGQLISIRVDGQELPSERMKYDDGVRVLLRAGRTQTNAVVRAAPMPRAKDLVAIGRIADSVHREIILLGRDRLDLVFRYRMRARSARLEAPTFGLTRVFPDSSDVDPEGLAPPESLSATLEHGQLRLAASSPDVAREVVFRLSPLLAWTFFLPFDYWIGPSAATISLLWLGILLVPVGYWAAFAVQSRQRRWLGVSILVIVIGALAGIPLAFGFPALGIGAYLAALAAGAVGWALALAVDRRLMTA